jgi:hypothetical protein
MSGEAWTDVLETELTFPRIVARHGYWRENPPSPILLRALAVSFGAWQPQRPAANDAVAALRALFPSGRI